MPTQSLPIKVVALDPGRTTGYAMGEISEAGEMLVVTGENEWDHAQLMANLQWYKPDVIVTEKFDFRRSPKSQRDKVDLYPRELIGVVMLYGSMATKDNPNDLPPCILHFQSASQAKGYYNDRKLKQDDLHKPNKPHANDAVRHLLHWFTFGPGYKYNKEGYKSGGR